MCPTIHTSSMANSHNDAISLVARSVRGRVRDKVRVAFFILLPYHNTHTHTQSPYVHNNTLL